MTLMHRFSSTFNKSAPHKILSITLLTVASASAPPHAHGQGAFAEQLGVTGQCTLCHNSPEGGLDTVKPAAKQAYIKGGVIPGLRNFLTPPITNAKPVILPVNGEWNVQVNEAPLVIPLIIQDEEQKGFLLELTGAIPSLIPNSYNFSKLYLEATKKRPTLDFKWTPHSQQKTAKYTLSFRAYETLDNGTKQFSLPLKTSVFVWPARPPSSKNVVSQLIINEAKWATDNLTLSGQLLFKKTATPNDRATALKNLRLNLKNNKGIIIGLPALLKPNATGAWSSRFKLTGTQVPCVAKVDYEKLIAARTVKSAPASCKN